MAKKKWTEALYICIFDCKKELGSDTGVNEVPPPTPWELSNKYPVGNRVEQKLSWKICVPKKICPLANLYLILLKI